MGRDRTDIYYWKCDREAAFHGTSDYLLDQTRLMSRLQASLERRFPGEIENLAVASGQGNHRTFTALLSGRKVFIRTEDGMEGDDYFAVEAAVCKRVAAMGIPVPETIAYDCSRSPEAPFAWQVIPFIEAEDLNKHFKAGALRWEKVSGAIGSAVAAWQGLSMPGYGPFSALLAQREDILRALHPTAESYYRLNLGRHLDFLEDKGFLSRECTSRIKSAVNGHVGLLDRKGVLVHKDLALWNILGSPDSVEAFIDWDDTVIGDEMDDLSLMACFHGWDVLEGIVAGYERVKPLPKDASRRFWLCLLRNMLFKAVIRTGAGYFAKGGGFFLVSGGESLEDTTRRKIGLALDGLEKNLGLEHLA